MFVYSSLFTLYFLIVSAAASLFPEFLASFLKHSSSAVFDLLEDYQALCQDKVSFARVCDLVHLIFMIASLSFREL